MSGANTPVSGSQVAPDTLIVSWGSDTFQLVPGHPLRRLRCLLCPDPAGGHLVRLVTVYCMDGRSTVCGSLWPDAWLVHGWHPAPLDEHVIGAARGRHGTCTAQDHR